MSVVGGEVWFAAAPILASTFLPGSGARPRRSRRSRSPSTTLVRRSAQPGAEPKVPGLPTKVPPSVDCGRARRERSRRAVAAADHDGAGAPGDCGLARGGRATPGGRRAPATTASSTWKESAFPASAPAADAVAVLAPTALNVGPLPMRTRHETGAVRGAGLRRRLDREGLGLAGADVVPCGLAAAIGAGVGLLGRPPARRPGAAHDRELGRRAPDLQRPDALPAGVLDRDLVDDPRGVAQVLDLGADRRRGSERDRADAAETPATSATATARSSVERKPESARGPLMPRLILIAQPSRSPQSRLCVRSVDSAECRTSARPCIDRLFTEGTSAPGPNLPL